MKIAISGDFVIRSGSVANPMDLVPDASVEAEVLGEFDYRLVNLEGPVLARNTKAKPTAKCGPILRMDDAIWDVLRKMGVDGVTTANNHIGDYGPVGIIDTMNGARKHGIEFFGSGLNFDHAYGLRMIDVGGEKLAILAVNEHDGAILHEREPTPAFLDLGRLAKNITQARFQEIPVLVYYHGGNQHCPLPNPYMRNLFRRLVDLGASAVVATHAHCPQAWEVYRKAPLFYGLGNFCLIGRKDSKHGISFQLKRKLLHILGRGFPPVKELAKKSHEYGLTVVLEFNGGSVTVSKIRFSRFTVDDGLKWIHDDEHLSCVKRIKEINDILIDDKHYGKVWDAWCHILTPQHLSMIQRNLAGGKMIFSKDFRKRISIANRFGCESTRTMILDYLTRKKPPSSDMLDKTVELMGLWNDD
ncbi:MAG: CapA family protein [Opitutales bacterium]|nr:CapA family protein [Opitutales bacterium]